MSALKRFRTVVGNWVRDVAPSCQDMAHLQSRALDETLPFHVRLGVKGHLLHCVWCRRYGRQLRLLHEALRNCGDRLSEGLVGTLPPEARERMKECLRKEAG